MLRAGFRFRLVCLIASHTVRKPKPRVKPAARAATLKSVLDDDMAADGFVSPPHKSPQGSADLDICEERRRGGGWGQEDVSRQSDEELMSDITAKESWERPAGEYV